MAQVDSPEELVIKQIRNGVKVTPRFAPRSITILKLNYQRYFSLEYFESQSCASQMMSFQLTQEYMYHDSILIYTHS